MAVSRTGVNVRRPRRYVLDLPDPTQAEDRYLGVTRGNGPGRQAFSPRDYPRQRGDGPVTQSAVREKFGDDRKGCALVLRDEAWSA